MALALNKLKGHIGHRYCGIVCDCPDRDLDPTNDTTLRVFCLSPPASLQREGVREKEREGDGFMSASVGLDLQILSQDKLFQ